MVDTQRPLEAASHVHASILDGVIVLLDLRRQEFLRLNEVGTQIWERLAQGLTVGEVARELADQYAVTPEKLQSDVAEFVAVLLGRQLLECQPPRNGESAS